MQIKIFSISFNAASGGFEDAEVRTFLEDKEVVSISENFFERNEILYLTLIIKYLTKAPESLRPNSTSTRPNREQWKENLTEADMGLFNILRNWRTKRSQTDGVPTYIVFNNNELASIVKSKRQAVRI